MTRWVRLLAIVSAVCASASVCAGAPATTSTSQDFYLSLKARAALALAGKTASDRTFSANAASELELWRHTVPGIKLPFTAGILGNSEPAAPTLRTDSGANEWETQTFGGYGLFRAGENVYVKGKAGLAHQRISIAGTTLVADDERTAVAVGVGAGVRLNKSRMELEYSWFNNANFISVGYVF